MKLFFGNNLKYLRKKLDLNQSKVASLVDKGDTTIGNWEKGISEPNFSELNILSQFFCVSVNDLLNTDLTNTQLIQKKETPKNKLNAQLNAQGNAQLNRVNNIIDNFVMEEHEPYGRQCQACLLKDQIIAQKEETIKALKQTIEALQATRHPGNKKAS